MKTVSLVGSVSRKAGGLFESVRRLHQELIKANGHESGGAIRVSVFGMEDEFTAADQPAWAPVPVHTFKVRGPRSFGYAPGMLGRLRRRKADLLHMHGLWQFPSMAALWWHRRWRKPYIVSPHGMLDRWAVNNSRWKKRFGWIAYERRHLSSACCIRALCRSEAESVRALAIKTPICIIPNGVDLPNMTVEESASTSSGCSGPLDWLRERKLLLYLGRIHPKKGLAPLFKAWARLGRRTAPWVLAIAGWDQNGHERELKQLATGLGIWSEAGVDARAGGSLMFLGPQFGAAKGEWLRRCQAFILPSFSEGLPMAVLEAWAYAKPVLISPQCNLPEGLAAGAAIAIEPAAEQIAPALLELVNSADSMLIRMGQRGRSLVERQFSWPSVAAQMRGVYRWMLGYEPAPACIVEDGWGN